MISKDSFDHSYVLGALFLILVLTPFAQVTYGQGTADSDDVKEISIVGDSSVIAGEVYNFKVEIDDDVRNLSLLDFDIDFVLGLETTSLCTSINGEFHGSPITEETEFFITEDGVSTNGGMALKPPVNGPFVIAEFSCTVDSQWAGETFALEFEVFIPADELKPDDQTSDPKELSILLANQGGNQGGNQQPNPPPSVPADITLSPTSGSAGATVTVSGVGFGANSNFTVNFDSTTLTTTPASVLTTLDGTFVIAITVPAGASAGDHVITVSDASGKTATKAFSVTATTPPPSSSGGSSSSSRTGITLTPATGGGSTNVTISGVGFGPASAITVKFGSSTVSTTPASVVTGTDGTFITAITIPAGASAGDHVITVSDAYGKTATKAFSVTATTVPNPNPVQTPTASASITLAPTSGNAGGIVSISGAGFTATSNMTVKFDSTTVTTIPRNVVAGSNGTFSVTITIPPSATPGNHVITVSDTSGKTATKTLSITLPVPTTPAVLNMSPTGGGGGTTVTLTGSGFTPASSIAMTFDDTLMSTSIVTTKDGTFSASITIPVSAAAGSHVITVSDAYGRTATKNFSAIPQLGKVNVSPANGTATTQITIRGSNFGAGAPITIKFGEFNLKTSPPEVVASNDGSFLARLTVPRNATGGIAVLASDDTRRIGYTTFNVTGSKSSLSFSSDRLSPGSPVTISGAGFPPSTVVSVNIGNVNLTKVLTTLSGTFSVNADIPADIARGSHLVSVTDGVNIASSTISVGTEESVAPGMSELLSLANLSLADQSGSAISNVSEGMQVMVRSDLKNNQDADQQFFYIVQVKNSQGETVMLSWMGGIISANKQYFVAQSWVAEEQGEYVIEAFVWEDISNPVILAPGLKTAVTVT